MKKVSVIEKDVCYNSNEYADTPFKVRFEFTGEDVFRIGACQSMIKQNKGKLQINSMRIEPGDYTLLDEDDVLNSDWPDEGGQLIVYEESIYFYSQSRHDSGDQIESAPITFEEIMEGFKEEVTL